MFADDAACLGQLQQTPLSTGGGAFDPERSVVDDEQPRRAVTGMEDQVPRPDAQWPGQGTDRVLFVLRQPRKDRNVAHAGVYHGLDHGQVAHGSSLTDAAPGHLSCDKAAAPSRS
ncbi:hypothetical protein GCM10009638_01610 [Luteococcus sanguinis]